MEALKRPPTQIMKNLWIGTEWNSCSRDLLVELNIRYILNAGYPQCKNHFQEEHENYKYLTIELYDGNLEQDLLQYLEPSFVFIDEAINRNQGVVVHDKSGNSRAAAIIIAYVMYRSGCTLKEAYQHVKSMRKSVDPSMDFMVQLNSFEFDAIGFSSMIPSTDLTPEQMRLLRTRVLTPEIVGLKYGSAVPSLVNLIVEDFEDEIVDHIAQHMLQETWKELGIFYDAIKHHPRVLKLFRSTFYAYVKSKLEKIVAPLENITGKDLDKVGADVLQALFEFLSHMQRTTVTIFGTREGLDNALNQGQIYLSRVQGAKLFTMYLTRQVHKVMTQSQNYQNNEVEQDANEKLDKLVRVLRSLCATSQENSQTFIKYMTQLLANRLLSTTPNLDFEMNLIFKLRMAKFNALAQQMEEMIKDLNVVKDIKKNDDSKTTLNLKIASSNKLPAEYLMSSLMAMQGHSHSHDQSPQGHSEGHTHEHQTGPEHQHKKATKSNTNDKMDVDSAVSSMIPEFVLPPEVASTLSQFKEQFQGDESANKKLMVLPHLGECEMTYESKNKKYNLIVPTSVMIVLCCFEDKDQLAGQELQLQTNLPGRLLMQTLYTLTDGPVKLLLRDPSTTPIAPTNVFKLNEEFASKTKRVKIQLIPVPK